MCISFEKVEGTEVKEEMGVFVETGVQSLGELQKGL